MDNDFSLLSAYLDNELSADERAALESRLQTEQALQVELAELQQVMDMLKAMPVRKAPRNYTLDPAKFGQPPPTRKVIYPWRSLSMTMAAVAAAVMIVVAGVIFSVMGGSNENEQAASDAISLKEETISTNEVAQGIVSEIAAVPTTTTPPPPEVILFAATQQDAQLATTDLPDASVAAAPAQPTQSAANTAETAIPPGFVDPETGADSDLMYGMEAYDSMIPPIDDPYSQQPIPPAPGGMGGGAGGAGGGGGGEGAPIPMPQSTMLALQPTAPQQAQEESEAPPMAAAGASDMANTAPAEAAESAAGETSTSAVSRAQNPLFDQVFALVLNLFNTMFNLISW